ITVGGAPAAGDRILVSAASGAAGSIRSVISDPRDIAMAAPVRAQTSAANTGDGTVSSVQVTDRAHPDLLTTSVMDFTGHSTYSIDGAGAFPYTSGDDISINGVTFSISGTPAL